MRNLTLTIEDDILHQARKLARDQNTTVNQLVRRFLSQLIAKADKKRLARQRLRRMMSEKPLVVGEKTWTREELYER